jgi:3-hydroxyisobutyrate dehydrogenase
MMLKDLRLAQEASGSAAATPMGRRATELYTQMSEAGHDGLDFSGIMKMLGGET